MIPIKRSLSFKLDTRKGKTTNLPIRLRIAFLGKRIDISTGHSIDLDNWKNSEVKAGVVSKKGISSEVINNDLQNILTTVDNTFKLAELQDRIPDAEELKSIVLGLKNVKKKEARKDTDEEEDDETIPFFKVFDEFVKTNGKLNNWTNSTFTKFSAVKKHLQDFNPNLSFDFFNQDGLSDYIFFLEKTKNMRNSTIKKQLGFLTWYLVIPYKFKLL